MALTLIGRLGVFCALAMVLSLGPARAADTYQANLGPMPLNEAVKKNMLGRGEATATLDGKTLTVSGTFAGLPSPATAAHLIVGLAIGVPGTQSLDLAVGPNGTVSGKLALTAKQTAAFRTGKLYVQIDSRNAPTGTLWGWLLPGHVDAAADVPQQGPWFLPQLNTPTR